MDLPRDEVDDSMDPESVSPPQAFRREIPT